MLTYEQQLAQLRQMVGAERNAPTNKPTTVKEKNDEWNDVQKREAEDAIDYRRREDEWLEEAGYGTTFLTEDPRWPKDENKRMAMFEEEMNNNRYYKKYGQQVIQMAQELLAQVNDPNSPMDAQQAIKYGEQLIDQYVVEFDDEEANHGQY